MKIFFCINESGCAYWRARLPAGKIKQQKLADVEVMSLYNTDPEDILRLMSWADVVVSQSPQGLDAVTLLMNLQLSNKKVVVDYDDLAFSCSPLNPGYKHLGLKEVKVKEKDGKEYWLWKNGQEGFSLQDNAKRYRALLDILESCDMISTTTPTLQSGFQEHVSRKDKVVVLPNSVDFNLWKPFEYRKPYKEIRIGWTASSSHLSEIYLVRDVMGEVLKKYKGKVKFVIFGDVEEIAQSFDPDGVEFHSFVDLSVYPLKLASLQFDIGICPLESMKAGAVEFNRNKSALKWSEMAALKIPCVVSRLEPYNVVEDGVTGLVAGTDQEFIDKLGLLIEDEKTRKLIGQNAYEYNFEHYNLDKNARLWVNAYKGIL